MEPVSRKATGLELALRHKTDERFISHDFPGGSSGIRSPYLLERFFCGEVSPRDSTQVRDATTSRKEWI